MRILNAQQMREADRRTIDEIGIPSLVLMENAGRQVVAAMEASFEELHSSRVAVLSGRPRTRFWTVVIAHTGFCLSFVAMTVKATIASASEAILLTVFRRPSDRRSAEAARRPNAGTP